MELYSLKFYQTMNRPTPQERKMLQQLYSAPKPKPLGAGVFIGNMCIFEHISFAVCQEYKKINCPKAVVRSIFR